MREAHEQCKWINQFFSSQEADNKEGTNMAGRIAMEWHG
jgi:hypothetical protein